MSRVPSRGRGVFKEFTGEFAETVWPRGQALADARLLCVGRDAVCRLLRITGRGL